MEWADAERGLAELRALLEPRLGRRMSQEVLRSLLPLREAAGSSPLVLAQAIARLRDTFGARPPVGAPWDLGDCRALHECGIRKLWDVVNRVHYARPLRGVSPQEAAALAEHADALSPAFPDDAPEFRIAIAYHNVFTYQHHLLFAEPVERNDPRPVWTLHEAAAAQALPAGGRHHFTPLAAWPGRGVFWGLGLPPSASYAEPYAPAGFMFVPTRGRSLRLDDLSDLRALLMEAPLEVRPETLASLLWLLAAPFPQGARLELELPRLEDFAAWEAAYEDGKRTGREAQRVLGVGLQTAPPVAPELRLRFDPPGVELRYRPGKLELLS